jgi:hypothetical protein
MISGVGASAMRGKGSNTGAAFNSLRLFFGDSGLLPFVDYEARLRATAGCFHAFYFAPEI